LTHFLEAFRRLLLCNGNIADIQKQVFWLAGLTLGFLLLALGSLKYRILTHTYKIPKLKRLKEILSR
jgi:hypothetical protein